MINKNYINPKLYTLHIEQESTRAGFGDALYRLGHDRASVVVLTADLKESTKVDKFASAFPNRFFEVGVAEQNLAAVASGMAAMGKIPFITSYAIFSPGRNWEQIRTTICYNNQPVKIIGCHAGLMTGPDGGSHEALEDIALTRVLPRMTVVVPCDALEAAKATKAIADIDGPVYLRLGREKVPTITTKETPFKVGKINILRESPKAEVTIFACGYQVYIALLAAKKLAEDGIEVNVVNNHTIKPLDEKGILAEVKKTGAVVTVEDHQIAGGMGSAIAEFLAQNYSVPMEFIGVLDKFGQSGSHHVLYEHYGISVPAIMDAVQMVLARKVDKHHK